MPEIFIDGRPLQARDDQTVMEVAREHDIEIPHFCWHPQLSVPGNCRVCVVEVEADGGGWCDIACNMPVSPGMRVRTDSERVRARRKETLQFVTLNHPVDCGICDKAGECTLQDYHYRYNGERSISQDAKEHATKFFALSERIVLDNERCILCTRCVRFTREVSKSHSLGVQNRGDHSLIRPVGDGRFQSDPYSDNVIDLCPVGALLSRRFLHQARVWYLQPTPSVCPGCERGCNVDLWHRKPEWQLHKVDPARNARIERVTPRENPAVNGPWICNKGRDLADVFGRERATQPMLHGEVVGLSHALARARALIAQARCPVALVSSWGSNEELAAFARVFGARFTSFVKSDCQPAAGETVEDALLIKPDKNPNRAGALVHFAPLPGDSRAAFPPGTDLVLAWGQGVDLTALPAGARLVVLGAWPQPANGRADVFLPISVQTERAGHYTNFAGVVNGFEACFAKPPGVSDAVALFDLIGAPQAAEVTP